MSKSVNVIHLRALNLVCLILFPFLLLPHHFLRAIGCVASRTLLCIFQSWCGWARVWKVPLSEMELVYHFPEVLFSLNNKKNIHFLTQIPQQIFLTCILYGRLPGELSLSNLPLRPTGLWEELFLDFSSRNDTCKSSPVFPCAMGFVSI